MENTGDLEVLDPTIDSPSSEFSHANRLETLDGLTFGLLSNGKKNSEQLLQYVHEALAEKYDLPSPISDNKGNASRPCPPELLTKMSDECDVIITASGD